MSDHALDDSRPAHEGAATRPDLPRKVGFLGAMGVMAGIMIGSGIFRTPTSIAQHTELWIFVMMAWIVGGLLSLAGALTYAELAVKYPRSGGIYVFLREAYGKATAFTFGWTYLLISKPLAAAGIAIIFAEHFNTLTGFSLDPRVTTTMVLAALTWVNVAGVRQGAGLATALTALKMGALLAIALVGAAMIPGLSRTAGPTAPVSELPIGLAIAPVMAAVMWTYDGWSDVGAIAGEVREPTRTLPRVYVAGTLGVTLLYLGVNAVYLWAIPLEEMRVMKTVAPEVMGMLLGPWGSAGVTVLVLVSTLGSTHGSILTGARVSFAQARDGLLFSFLSRIHPRYETPAASLWVQLALSTVAVWSLGTFERLAGGFVFTMWIFYGLAALALFILRVRAPGARGYSCPGYPFVPGVFVLAALAMTLLSIAESPRDTLTWLGVLGAGFPVYYVWKRFARGEESVR